ncbi:Helix-turn-helix domain-containing protein [Xylanibacter ruminicola]|uniref:Helix-turn-helix domain-containing protein n=1 Tax=Xylanibacter ruminicola TaxID=839 RepID=A0A1H4DIL6_XYLRU|nr:helix-turn-helix domain-containing protein [Xylanibacter ruminicola]SEA72299.1 Helix-turn-helix domain-containing protein [Xylanibacter ruminicola]
MTRRYAIILLTVLLSILTAGAVNVSPRIFRNYTAANGLADNGAQTILCTKTGRLVITTAGQINFYDGASFSYIDPLDENIYALSDYRGNYHLYFDKYHHIWLKNTGSVTCVELITERFVPSIEDVFAEFGVKERVMDLFVDRTGVVWLLTANGLYSVATKQYIKPRAGLNLQDLEVYKDKFLMLFYENGLMEMYDIAKGKRLAENRPYNDDMARHYSASSLVMMDSTKVYQIRNGAKDAILMQYDVPRKEWTELLRTPYHLNSLVKHDSLLYVPCEYGYWTVHESSYETNHIEALSIVSGQPLETDINVIAFDRQGGMWAGTESRGILYSRPYKPPFIPYAWGTPTANQLGSMMSNVNQWPKFRDRTVNCVFKDSRGWTWVGTSQGLQVYRRESDLLPQVYTTKDGLYNNIVHSIVEDQAHHIWVATSYGISVVLFDEDGKVHFINSYNEYDHVPNEVFVNGKAMLLPDGQIAMQSLDHVVLFDPTKMSTLDNNYPFKIYPKLIKLMVNGIDVTPTTEIDGKRILNRALSRVWGLDLNYNQNSLTLVFSALNYFRPQQTFYRVRVLGLDEEWRVLSPFSSDMVDKDGLLHLPLIALRPGHYTIQVQASLAPDVWDTRPYEWTIDVNEPWWRSVGLFGLLAFVLVVMAGINLFYYMKNANLRAMRNSEEIGLINRIYAFVDRCNTSAEVLEPVVEEYTSSQLDPQVELDADFLKIYKKIAPVVELERKKKKMTMRRLSNAAGMDAKTFYQVITTNIFKSPRPLIKQARLQQAERMLRNTKEPLEVIADKCGFISVNFLISQFFQVYRVTPDQYRRKR